jgi:hypothetical protein
VGRLQLLLDATLPAALTSNPSGDAMMCTIQSPSLLVQVRVARARAVVCRYFGWSARPLQ